MGDEQGKGFKVTDRRVRNDGEAADDAAAADEQAPAGDEDAATGDAATGDEAAESEATGGEAAESEATGGEAAESEATGGEAAESEATGGEAAGATGDADPAGDAAADAGAGAAGAAGEGAGELPITFAAFVMSLGESAMVHLGHVPSPTSGEPAKDLRMARQTIDILGILEEKTRGNRSEEEDKLLNGLLYALRMQFIEAGSDGD